mgnify:CR=1 FL=1
MNAPQDAQTDEELAALVQGNNQEAFGVLMDRYQDKLLRYGRRFLSRGTSVDDAVQDVFIKVYENIRSFDATKKFSPWIYRIAHNEFISTLRANSRAPIAIDMDTLVAHPSYEMDPAGEEERSQMQSAVERGLEVLPEAQREVVILYYLEELSYQEISDILRIPLGTVGVRLRRARAALKKNFETHVER